MFKKAICILAACVVGLGLFCGCGDDTPAGTFYTLQEAYDKGYLTQEDLMSIAYYNNGGREGNEEIMAEDYAPIPKDPEVLDSRTETAIKETMAYIIRNSTQEPIPEASANGIEVVQYFGGYSECYVVTIRDYYYIRPTDVPVRWETIGEVNIRIVGYDLLRAFKKA